MVGEAVPCWWCCAVAGEAVPWLVKLCRAGEAVWLLRSSFFLRNLLNVGGGWLILTACIMTLTACIVMLLSSSCRGT